MFCADGRYLVCGSEDGRVVIWDADGGPPTLLPHFTLGGDTVYQVRAAGGDMGNMRMRRVPPEPVTSSGNARYRVSSSTWLHPSYTLHPGRCAIAVAPCPCQVAWNPLFHIAAVCSFASWAPMLLVAYNPRVADVALSIGHKNSLELMGKDRKQVGAGGPKGQLRHAGDVTRVRVGGTGCCRQGTDALFPRSQPMSVMVLYCDLCP